MAPLRVRVGILGVALVSGACWSRAELDLPWPEDAASALLFEVDGGDLYALEPGDRPALSLDQAAPLEALFFDFELEAAQLEPGRVVLEGDASRPIPPAAMRVQGTREGPRFAWAALPDDPDDPRRRRLPPLDLRRCLDAGRCVSADGLLCEACDPTVAARPEAFVIPCPWGDPATDAADCRPAVVTPEDCPFGERPLVDAAGCIALSECPSDPTAYPPGFVGTTGAVFVRPTGVPGDGSPDRPHGTLAEAAAATGAQGTWVLGPGTFNESFTLPPGADLTIVGPCAARVTIDGGPLPGIVAGSGALRVEGVHVMGSSAEVSLVARDVRLDLVAVEVGPSSAVSLLASSSVVEIEGSAVRGPATALRHEQGELRVSESHFVGLFGVQAAQSEVFEIEAVTAKYVGAEPVEGVGVSLDRCPRPSIVGLRTGGHPRAGVGILPSNEATVENIAVGPGSTIGLYLGVTDALPPGSGPQGATVRAAYFESTSRNGILADTGTYVFEQVFSHASGRAGISIERKNDDVQATLHDIFVADSGTQSVQVATDTNSLGGPTTNVERLRCELSSRRVQVNQVCLEVEDASVAIVTDMMVRGGYESAIRADDGSVLTLTNAVVQDTVGPSFDLLGIGTAVLDRVRIVGVGGPAILVRGGANRVLLTDIDIEYAPTALVVESDAPVTFDGLSATEVDVGLELRGATRVESLGGHLRARRDGVRYDPATNLGPALRGLHVEAPQVLVEIQ